jgi:zinc protease
LTDGESSRLHQKLVRDKAIAQEVGGWTEDHRGPDMLALEVKMAEGQRLADAEKATDVMIESLAKDGPSDAEMKKVRNRTESAFLFGLQSNLQRATQLGQFELFWGDARLLNSEPPKYMAVTKADIQRVVRQYLVPARRTLVEVRPTGMVDPPPPPAPAAPAPARPAPKTHDKHAPSKSGKASLPVGKEIEGGLHKPRHRREKP